MNFAENLAMQMEARHETKYRLAKEIGVHQTTVANWLNGYNTPQLEHLARLADHYGCSIQEFSQKDSG